MSCYIEYLNASKGFLNDIIRFEGDDAFELAVAWGKENLDNFSIDMIRISTKA